LKTSSLLINKAASIPRHALTALNPFAELRALLLLEASH